MLQDQKLLIIHMDDVGMSYAANRAAMDLFNKGTVTSASVMMPCAWACDFIKWTRENPQFDIGIHTTFTCEWDVARWRPLSGEEEIPGLYDEEGFAPRTGDRVGKTVSPEQFRQEMKRQIRLAVKWGLKFSHLDNHMWVAAANPEFFRIYLEEAAACGVAAHIPQWLGYSCEMEEIYRQSGLRRVDASIALPGGDCSYEAKKEAFYKKLENVKPGLNIITIHPLIDTPEIREIVPDFRNRNAEYKIFMEDTTAGEIKKNGIRLIDWSGIAGKGRGEAM